MGWAAPAGARQGDDGRIDLRSRASRDESSEDGAEAFRGGSRMSDGSGAAKEAVRFFLDGEEVAARPGETIWQVANRNGTEIPHLCYTPAPGYRPDGNCRACMVEIEGERVLAASCIRQPTAGMKVKTESERRAGKEGRSRW